MNAKDYVEWFHSKYRDRSNDRWPEMLHDHEALFDIIKKFKVKTVFEIGTWEGFTTLFMWLIDTVTKIKTIDICEFYGHEYHNPQNGIYGFYLQNTKIELQIISSMEYSPTDGEQWDMVFVEGNHEYEYVKSDFILALSMNPKVIVFHDYRNGNHGVDKYIDELNLIPAISERLTIRGNGSCIVFYDNTEWKSK